MLREDSAEKIKIRKANKITQSTKSDQPINTEVKIKNKKP